MNQKTEKKLLPFLAGGSVILLCYIFNISLLFGGESKLLTLFRTPMPLASFGGNILYAVFYGIFFISVILLAFFNKKSVAIPAAGLILFETIMLFLPAAYYANQFGRKHAGYYLASLFSDRLPLTLKSVAVILLGILIFSAAVSRGKIKTTVSVAAIILTVTTISAECVYILMPAANSETLSFWLKFPFSVIFDLFRFIPFTVIPFLEFSKQKQQTP